MKLLKITSLALLTISLGFISCKSKTSETTSATDNKTEAANATPKGRYAIKSGIVEYKTEIMGMPAKQTLIFDDYGQKELTDMEMEMMGTKIRTVTITKDGFIYTLDLEKKTGTRISGKSPNIDFENLSEEMVKDMNLKKEGNEEYLGKPCEKMSIDYTKMKMKGSFLVYKGVALKLDTDMGTMKMKLIGEKFIENPDIPAAKFDVPADIKISEL